MNFTQMSWRAGLVGAALLAAAGCKRGNKQMEMPARPPAAVTVAAATAADVPVYLDEIGKAVATAVVAVIPQVGGKIVSAKVEDGAFVKKGDLLFEIDARPFDATLAAMKASLEQYQAEQALAKVE
ncbi:MAG TPA: biotin/lipoyl-binding protein, partial [Tepidisphaeraceae bacterium]